jgi:aminopeptidase
MHIKKGKGITFQNLDPEFFAVTVVGLGIEDLGFNPLENMDECKETIRVAAAVGARKLKAIGMRQIFCEGFGHTESAAEGANLAVWRYQGQRSIKKKPIVLELYHDDDK